MTASLPDGSAQVFSEVTRISQLDVFGNIAPGSVLYTTDQLLSATFTPVMETGVDLTELNANADLIQRFKHGDMIKYYTMQIKVATPDPALHALFTGGTVFNDASVAIGPPTGSLAAVAQATLGFLAAGTYGYKVSGYNYYGETVPTTEVTATTTGSTGAVVISGYPYGSPPATLVGYRLYGRTVGGEQLMATQPNVGVQTLTSASGTGTPTTLAISTGLTVPLPLGFTFTITGDTNTTKIVFTTTQAVGKGAVVIPVSVSQTITTTITAATIVPCFVDNGTLVPSGAPVLTDVSAGPGNDVGFQAPALGSVSNPNGVGIEFFAKATKNGIQNPVWPWWRWVVPGVKNMHDEARAFDATFQDNMYTGQAFENPNWGSGPVGDFQFDSSRAYQYVRFGGALPKSSLVLGAATY